MITAAFVLWPLVGLAFFLTLRLPLAIAATVIGGYLLLPATELINLPLLPTVDKDLVPPLTALVLALLFYRKGAVEAQPGWLPRSGPILAFGALLIAGAFMTVLTNGDTLSYGETTLPALRPFDGLAAVQGVLVALLPFVLARKFFATPESHRTLLLVLVVAAMGYSLLALYEVRMSPQLSLKIYGFFPHDWGMHKRGGGFRPVVFLQHGLWLTLFFSCATLAAFGLWRVGGVPKRGAFLFAGLWLLMTLVLSKSLGSLVVTLALLPVLLLLPFRLQILAAAAVATILITYPVIRAAGYVPTDRIAAIANDIDPARAQSLQYRFDNEDILLAKAKERPLFGWGGWGRSRVYDDRGVDISTTDGRWVILFGQRGWAGYVGEFGLLTFAVFALALRWRRFPLDPATAVLAVVLAANLIDLIPNSGLTQVTYLMAGALAGRLELARDAALRGGEGRAGASPPVGQPARRGPAPGPLQPAGLAPDGRGQATLRFSRFPPKT